MARDHELKCWPEEFQALSAGTQIATLRFKDRDFKVGDTLTLREFVPSDTDGPWMHPTGRYTGEFERRRIRHVAGVGRWAPGCALLSLEPL